MKTLIISAFAMIAFISKTNAQQFLEKAVIEYEVKANIKKTMGSGQWAEMMKDNLPTFKISYYTLNFADNKSLYKFDHWDEKQKLPDYMKRDDEGDNWYMDYNTGKMVAQKNVIGTTFNISDSMPAMEWKMTNESRMIAGFNCRKAVAKMFDSVYVFAFYTDEIVLPGGPCSIHGLPGTILGVTIPRLFTSWIATKVSVNGLVQSIIKPAESKKYYTNASLRNTIDERTKDWWDDSENPEEGKQEKNRFIWSALL